MPHEGETTSQIMAIDPLEITSTINILDGKSCTQGANFGIYSHQYRWVQVWFYTGVHVSKNTPSEVLSYRNLPT